MKIRFELMTFRANRTNVKLNQILPTHAAFLLHSRHNPCRFITEIHYKAKHSFAKRQNENENANKNPWLDSVCLIE